MIFSVFDDCAKADDGAKDVSATTAVAAQAAASILNFGIGRFPSIALGVRQRDLFRGPPQGGPRQLRCRILAGYAVSWSAKRLGRQAPGSRPHSQTRSRMHRSTTDDGCGGRRDT